MSILRVSVVAMAGPPSIGWPSGLTTRPMIASRPAFQQSAGGFDGVAFLDLQVVAEDDRADGLFFKVEDLAHRAVLEFQQFAGHRIAKAIDAGDAVADFDNGSDFRDLSFCSKPAISCFRTLVISATLIAIFSPKNF